MYPTFCLNPKADQSKNKNLKKTPRGGVIGTLNTWLKAQCGLNFSNEKKSQKIELHSHIIRNVRVNRTPRRCSTRRQQQRRV